ncbi:hypothetical protein ACFSHT_28550 [Paraburkholderia silviterrae]|uniref:Transcriptional activator TraM n=1 Tax=Paraburkholderia silviterrae TaxID=2528715 RepID=A0A4R5M6J7_9BURK|nr:hypothetical protein [Paraburkholderia silviterrae]TDG21216.1 hypothetical protein EYW47_22915 [Paraburkholderia silviterrae]
MNEPTPQPDHAGKASERLGQLIATMPASNELAVLAEILIEQMKVVDAQHHVVALIESTDQKLTATVQALREENAQLAKLLTQSRQAFIGEIAAKAADQARRAATADVADELARLRVAVESRDRAVNTKPVVPATGSIAARMGIAFCAGAALIWIVARLAHTLI